MQDSTLLAACLADRTAWNKIHKHIEATDLTPTVGFWWKVLAEAYKRDIHANALSVDLLGELGRSSIPSPKQADSLLGVLSSLVPPVSPINTVHVALEIKRKNLTAEFASAQMGGDKKKANKLLASLNEIWETDSFEEKQAEWHDARATIALFDKIGRDKRIPFGCPGINQRLDGGLLPGHHVGIFGRTEVGKSTFVIDAVARLLKQQQTVLYIGNEDQIDILKLRLVGRYLKQTQAHLEAHKEQVAEDFRDVEERLLMTQLYQGDIDAIRKRVEEFKPSVLVIDQFRNLTGKDTDGMTQRMEANAIKLRALLLSHSLIGVSVTQANDRSERHGQEAPIYLSTGDIDSSRVGLPGQCDLLLGIGANSDLMARGQRFISFAKNKLSSARDAHEGVIVNFDLAISRVS
jgi:KaiC/GvpD/RAD55 family RecA-like ATPase